jgi:hypothetical protein
VDGGRIRRFHRPHQSEVGQDAVTLPRGVRSAGVALVSAALVVEPAPLDLLTALRECKTQLCVDHGFDLREAKNRSRIGGEYLNRLRVGTPGYEMVAYLAGDVPVDVEIGGRALLTLSQ